jgi:hypothetical protein
MPSTVLASIVLSLAVQAQAAAPLPAAGLRMPGIVESPGSRRMPGLVEVHAELDRSAYRTDLRAARRHIDRRRRSGELSRREARQLRREVAMIATLAHRYGRDGLSESERRELDMHAQTVRMQSAVR